MTYDGTIPEVEETEEEEAVTPDPLEGFLANGGGGR